MTAAVSVLDQVGAGCFGVAIGYVTYRTLVRTTDKAAVTDIVAVVGAVGGGAVTGLFQPATKLFAWYAIGLLAGMLVFFLLFGFLNGWKELAKVMGGDGEVLTRSSGPNRPQG
jgi:hypothetical protein